MPLTAKLLLIQHVFVSIGLCVVLVEARFVLTCLVFLFRSRFLIVCEGRVFYVGVTWCPMDRMHNIRERSGSVASHWPCQTKVMHVVCADRKTIILELDKCLIARLLLMIMAFSVCCVDPI